MNWKKIQVIAGCVFLSVASVFAASSNERGIEFFRADLYDAAKIYLKEQTKNLQGSDLAESYYYIGRSYVATEQLDSAAAFFSKAIETDPKYPYGYVGEGMLALKNNNENSANDLFKKAIGLTKKHAAILVAVAEAYIGVNQYAKAEEMLGRARRIKKDFSGIYGAEGDMLMSQEKTGDAAARYEQAILFNPDDKIAHLKKARIYKAINADLSLEVLNNLLIKDPEFIPAYAELGDTYYRMDNYTKAIEAYQKFIEIPGVPAQQLINYASLLYFTKNYEKSLEIINQVLEKDPNNFVMRRLQFYNSFELGNFELGLEQAKKFIETVPQEDLIAQDYIYYGRLLDKHEDSQGAIDAFNKAYNIDPTKTDAFLDLAQAYERIEDYNNAIVFYKKFTENDRNATLLDVFNFGRLVYNAGTQEIVAQDKTAEEIATDSLMRRDYLLLADSIFAQVVERSPDSYLGYLWRAHSNAALDPEVTLGLAKPHYEQAAAKLETLPESTSRNRYLVDCYRYLGYYYYLKEDYCISKEYFQKILVLEPENEVATQVLNDDAIKKMKCN